MKTIKELYKELYEAESCDEVDTSKYRADKESKIEALKDILELIDRVFRNKKAQIKRAELTRSMTNNIVPRVIDELEQELKARIEGNDLNQDKCEGGKNE